MKIAAYNVENLFDRAKAFNEESAEAQRVIKQEAELNALFQKPGYTPANKKRILELLKALGILRTDEGPFVILRKIRGQFIKRPQNGPVEILANGRADWVVEFSKAGEGTKVEVELTFKSQADMEKIMELGFKEGFSSAHTNLDELLAE